MLMDMMGHKKIETTRKYYLSSENPDLWQRTFDILNTIYPKPEDKTVLVIDSKAVQRRQKKLAHIPRKK